MYETLKRLYRTNANKLLLENAVKKAWITQAEMERIIEDIDTAE